MRFRYLIPVILTILVGFGCSGIKPQSFENLECKKVKLKIKVRGNKERYSTTAIVKFHKEKLKIFFLGGVVKQVVMKLQVEEEDAILVNQRKKGFWRGKFTDLTFRMWGVKVKAEEFLELIISGKIPINANRKLRVFFKGNFPDKFRIEDKERNIIIKNGKVSVSRDSFRLKTSGLKSLTLGEVLGNG